MRDATARFRCCGATGRRWAIIRGCSPSLRIPRVRLKLLASPTSPYARKVRDRARGEADRVRSWSTCRRGMPPSEVSAFNPLGKVPVLGLDDGTTLYDSRVIVEYLDTVSPVSRLIPEPSRAAHRRPTLGGARRRHLRRHGRGDRLERKRSGAPAEQGVDRAAAAQDRARRGRARARPGRAALVQRRSLFARRHRHGLRARLSRSALPELDWRDAYPNLARLAEQLGKRPSFAETVPPPADAAVSGRRPLPGEPVLPPASIQGRKARSREAVGEGVEKEGICGFSFQRGLSGNGSVQPRLCHTFRTGQMYRSSSFATRLE